MKTHESHDKFIVFFFWLYTCLSPLYITPSPSPSPGFWSWWCVHVSTQPKTPFFFFFFYQCATGGIQATIFFFPLYGLYFPLVFSNRQENPKTNPPNEKKNKIKYSGILMQVASIIINFFQLNQWNKLKLKFQQVN